jgi:beta-N-acetylhexosaminidase
MAVKDSFRVLRRRSRILVLVLVVAVAGAAGAVVVLRTGDQKKPAAVLPPASGSASTGPVSHRSFLERVIPPPAERPPSGPTVARSVSDLARRLPLERKVAQLFIFGFDGTDSSAPIFGDLARLDIGALAITSDNYSDPQQLLALTTAALDLAKKQGHVPPWLLTEQDGGDFSELSDLPPADPPSKIESTKAAADDAAQTASALRQVGINGVLGPDVDVDTGQGGAYSLLTYSDAPDEVARFASVTVKAFAREKMFVAPKHFPGLGAASQPTDEGAANVGLTPQQLATRDLVPFKAAFDAGATGVMLGHGLYSTDEFVTPASQSSALATGLLRGNLRFGGVAVTDDLESPAITGTQSVPDAAVAAIKAGADMVWISGPRSDQNAAYLAVLNAARRGEIRAARIQAALLRILQTKQELGLISRG